MIGQLLRTDDERLRATERAYLFGDFCLMPDRQVLLHDGAPVRIGSRAFDILALLVHHAGELVTKAELEAYVWPRTFLHESNLKVHVAALRKVLRAASDEAATIVNIPGRGYCFTTPVRIQGRARVSVRRATAARASAFAPPLRIIGRDDEIASLAKIVAGQPLTTVVGPGGVGKTTVALAVAERLSRNGDTTPVFVDLATIDDPQLVVHAIAAAAGRRVDLSDLLGGIAEHLRTTTRLLILDNCEHLSAAVAMAADYLAADLGDGSALLATSREPLRARHEHVVRLAPLACPAPAARTTAARALTYPAVALFLDRAGGRAGRVLTEEDAEAVSAICRRLDGLPLAIALAAARLNGHKLAELLTLLQDTIAPLSQDDLATPARQRALTATLDWSYRLLSEAEARVLRFASIFAGDFTLEDAVAVLGPGGLEASTISAAMESLVAKSFALADVAQAARRYRLFESTRSYALDRLEASGEAELARTLHATHILTVLERAEEESSWRSMADWLAQHAPRLDDLRRAITWAFAPQGDRMVGVRLTVAALPMWSALCSTEETVERVKEALEAAIDLPACDARLKMKLMLSRAWTLTFTEITSTSPKPPWRDCIGLAREVGDTEYLLRALHGLATYESFTGQCHAAIDHLLEYEAIAEGAREWWAMPDAIRLLGLLRAYVGDLREGGQILEDLAGRFDRVESRAPATRFAIDRFCIIHSSYAFTLWLRGRTETALAQADRALEAAIAVDHPATHLNTLAFSSVPLALWSGRLDLAEARVAAMQQNLSFANREVWRRLTRFFLASLRQAQGEPAMVGEMGDSLDAFLDTGLVTRAPMYLTMLAHALLKEGLVADARARIEDAAHRLERYRERWCRPEILRIQGLIQLAEGDTLGGHSSLAEAVVDARAQGALILELRAATALARRLADEGRRDEAVAVLSPVCAMFTERHGSQDLAEAVALLDRLA
jgi:predicted ATPase/DNA-binding winged helix-turn-helix (wHTH) protein